jgi:SAM-dependent methyltransferase
MMSLEITLCCPKCKTILKQEASGLLCSRCKVSYPIIDGIPSFVDDDEFYEGRNAETIFHKGKSSFSTKRLRARFSKEGRLYKRVCRNKGLVLDIGCGGGNTFFTTLGPVVGVDISLESVKKARNIYQMAVRADITELPFVNQTFDYIVSANVLGHIPAEQKTKLFSEMYRVLKKGGRVIHNIETEGRNSFQKIAESFPELYRRHFIERPGHYGLELPSEAMNRFDKVGFKLVEKIGTNTGFIRPLGEYIDKFDNEYKDRCISLKMAIVPINIILKSKILKRPVHGLIVLLRSIIDSFSSIEKANGTYVCFEK